MTKLEFETKMREIFEENGCKGINHFRYNEKENNVAIDYNPYFSSRSNRQTSFAFLKQIACFTISDDEDVIANLYIESWDGDHTYSITINNLSLYKIPTQISNKKI